jgi:hypothetical protein
MRARIACAVALLGLIGADHAAATCRPAATRSGSPPAWARLPGVPAPPTPFALARGDRAAAFLFVHPLRVHLPPGGANKVLWALGAADGALRIRATHGRLHRRWVAAVGDEAGARVQRVRMTFPEAGCWRLHLAWGARRATLDVAVAA